MAHGVTVLEQATSIKPPVTATAALPVFIGTAPVHRTHNPSAAVQKAVVCYSYSEAVAAFGYSDDWETWTLCEAMTRQFRYYAVAPAVFIQVFDPSKGQTTVPANDIPVINSKAVIDEELADIVTLVVKPTSGGAKSILGTDYLASYSADGIDITILPGGALKNAEQINVEYKIVDPSKVASKDILGGVDASTGQRTGIELVDTVFPLTRLVPGILAAPGWNDTEVSIALTAKASTKINGLFRCISVVDVPDSAGLSYRDIPAWKEQNGLSSEFCVACWPRITLGGREFHMSTDIAGLLGRTDYDNGDIPFASPSNRPLQIDGLSWLGKEVVLDKGQVDYLGDNGIMSALNWIGGWRAWGNHTCVYPASTDPKDMWISIRRMFNWVNNSIVLSYWQRIDLPIRRVLIDDIVTSVNIWFNGLVAQGALLGGRIEFNAADNPNTALMDGKITFRVYICPPTPAQEIAFVLEYDPAYLSTLFEAA